MNSPTTLSPIHPPPVLPRPPVRGPSGPATASAASPLSPVILLPSKHTTPRSPSTSEPPRQCAPRVQVLPPCVADYPSFCITCTNRCGKDLGQPGRRFSPASLPRPLSQTAPAASSRLQSTWLLSHQPIAFHSSRPHQNFAWGPCPGIPLPAPPLPPQHSYPHQAPYQPQYQIPHHRASVPIPQQPHMHPRSNTVQPPPRPPPPPSGTPPHHPVTTAFLTVQHPSHDPALKINWARDVLMLVDRAQQNSSGDAPPVGPATIQDPQLLRLVQIASAQHPTLIPIFAADAIYLRATFSVSGMYLDHVQHNPVARAG
jgi:hypothetical protein